MTDQPPFVVSLSTAFARSNTGALASSAGLSWSGTDVCRFGFMRLVSSPLMSLSSCRGQQFQATLFYS